jgi:hypothetical protein
MGNVILLGDSDIRPALRSKLCLKYANDTDTVVIEELGLCRGQVRVDVSVVNGLLHGYEIKSDRDTLQRLNTQIEIYGKVFDRATLVVGFRHLAKVLDILPLWWGILLVQQSTHGLRFKPVRKPRNNPNRDPRALVELLWSNDALALLETLDAARGFRGKPRWIVWNRVCELFDAKEIAKAVRVQLKSRVRKQALV